MTIATPPSSATCHLPTATRKWLTIGVVALAVAGLYSLTLVLGRAPIFSNNPEIQRIFKDALVVHVDLSVLVWFLSVACMVWSMASAGRKSALHYTEQTAQICMALAVVLMMASPFTPGATAMMSNYIPTISSPLFFLSLALIFCSAAIMAGRALLAPVRAGSLLDLASVTSALITVAAIACFVWSYFLMPSIIEGEQYYDMLFWGGGHVLQLTHTQILMLAWLLISAHLGLFSAQKKWMSFLFAVGVAAAFLSPLAYLLYGVESMEFRQFFTHKMIALGGLAPGLLGLVIFVWCVRGIHLRKGESRALWSCLLCSSILFLYGGVLGLLITGQNVVIPAHYHGSIVGVTLGFMGLAYLLLPRFGWRDMAGTKIAYWQPIVYSIGQVMHISGLAYSGGYGVLRKTAGGVDALPMNIKAALGFMGMGGLFAIAGGLMFVLAVWRATKNPLPSGERAG